ncbi:MAG: hypothetical protein IKC72_06075 [Clostridia bacterium]|nr:hypothetical protein [Clostridia bacterium]
MKVIICVDNEMGIAFNHRRQSRDRILIEDVIKMTEKALFCAPYSKTLLEEHPHLIVSETPLDDAMEENYVFAEMLSLSAYAEKIDTLVLYRWNRTYPSDKTFDLDLSHFTLISSENFVGYSHEKITKEVYVK